MSYQVRRATLTDRPAMEALIAQSARGLSQGDYTDEQIEAALGDVFGVDSDLIRDGTYMVAEHADQLVGCGGWSKRRTLFGGDAYAGRAPALLDPAREPAKIRAFFVHPDWARQGIGGAIYAACEAAAQAAGFQALELMATLPGVRLYRELGFVGTERVTHELRGGIPIEFVPMHKPLT